MNVSDNAMIPKGRGKHKLECVKRERNYGVKVKGGVGTITEEVWTLWGREQVVTG